MNTPKYIIKEQNGQFNISKWNKLAEKYVPCIFKRTRIEAEEFIKRALAVTR